MSMMDHAPTAADYARSAADDAKKLADDNADMLRRLNRRIKFLEDILIRNGLITADQLKIKPKKKKTALPTITKGSAYRRNDIVRIKKFPKDHPNARGRVDGNPTDDKVWVTNLNQPFCGTINQFMKPTDIKLLSRES